MVHRVPTLLLLLAGLVTLSVSEPAHACNVPVYRYALERWRPDPYRVVVFHRGPLGEAGKDWITPLEERDDKTSSNVALRTVDLDTTEEAADRALFESLKNPTLPFLVVQFPAHLQIETPVWSGPLDHAAVERLTDSPVRRELVHRLAGGQTAVWLILESGDAQKDDAAAAILKEELKALQKSLKLPDLTDSIEDSLLTASPLRIEFSLLRVPRDPAEQALVGMLLQSEPDLPERADPMAFPVFGRGRAMYGLVGKGITPANIRDSAAFLVGACSCQIKEQNPGFDLLLTAAWDNLIFPEATPPTPTRPPESPKEPELIPIPRGSAAPEPSNLPPASTSVTATSTAITDRAIPGWPIGPGYAIFGGFATVVGLLALRRLWTQ